MDAKELRKRSIIGQQQAALRARKAAEAEEKRQEKERKAYFTKERQAWLDELQTGIAKAADNGEFTYTLNKTFYDSQPSALSLMFDLAKEFPRPDFGTATRSSCDAGVGSDPGPTLYQYSLWVSWKDRNA